MIFSTQQNNVFDFVKDNTKKHGVVEAVAGSGKTTTIVEALKYMDGDVFLGAFNKKMATELEERTKKYMNVKVSTFHALGLAALRAAFRDTTMRIESNKVRDIFAAVDLLPAEYSRVATRMVSFAKIDGFGLGDGYPAIEKYGSWTNIMKHHGLYSDLPDIEDVDFSDYPHVTFQIDKDGTKKLNLKHLFDCCIDVLTRSNKVIERIDFDDMIYLALLRKGRFKKYDWFLIDEAQDTSPVRLFMATKSLKVTGRLLAVGDRFQAIYGFAGAMSDSIDHIVKVFDAEKLPLSVCYRCEQDIIKEAQKINPAIEWRKDADKGTVESTTVHKDFVKSIKNSDVILCRLTAPLVDLAFELLRDNKIAKVEGKDMAAQIIRIVKASKSNTITGLKKFMYNKATKAYAEYYADMSSTEAAQRLYHTIQDTVTIRCFYIEAANRGITSTHELLPLIESIFADEVSKDSIRLSTIHRAKGLEFDKVFILHNSELCPPKNVDKNHWQYEQEMNLRYVAITRAKNELVFVNTPIELGDVLGAYKDLVATEWASYPE